MGRFAFGSVRMTGLSSSPRLIKGGIVILDAAKGSVQRILVLQYNPDTLTRSFSVQSHGENAERSSALRFKGPAVETFKLDAEIDATDYLEFPDQHAEVLKFGLHPQIAALEALVNPTSAQLNSVHGLGGSGSLEVIPAEAPLTLFVWGGNRIQPVRVTDLSVTEEAFDPLLNPLRAKLSLGLRVLSVADVGFDHRAGALFMSYLRGRETLAKAAPAGTFGALGIGGLP